MIHVLIETSAFAHDLYQCSPSFRALTSLAQAGRLQIHLPLFVKHEIIGLRHDELKEPFLKVRRAAKVLGYHGSDLANNTRKRLSDVLVSASDLDQLAREDLEAWISDTATKIQEIDDAQVARVVEGYFRGSPPFRQRRSRTDIPDAFVYEATRQIAQTNEELSVVVNDQRLKKAIASLQGVTAIFESLHEFIGTDEVQDQLLEETVESNVKRVLAWEDLEAYLNSSLEDKILGALVAKTVTHRAILSDDNEGTIGEVGSPDHTTFDIEGADYYGHGELGIDFETEVECMVESFVPIGEYSHDDAISATSWNKTYNLRQKYFIFTVTGTLLLCLALDTLAEVDPGSEDIAARIKGATIEIDIQHMKLNAPGY